MSPGPHPEEPAEPPPIPRLDPDQAAPPPSAHAAQPAAGGPDRPDRGYRPVTVDPRPYRWMVGVIGLVLILGVGAYQFITHGTRSSGVPPGSGCTCSPPRWPTAP